MTALSPKQFYIARRAPAFADRAEFQKNWRGHGELAMSQPLWANIFRYTQGDSIDLPKEAGERLPEYDSKLDGVATIWFHTFDSALAIGDAPEHPIPLRRSDEGHAPTA
jgi:hypothetical protein